MPAKRKRSDSEGDSGPGLKDPNALVFGEHNNPSTANSSALETNKTQKLKIEYREGDLFEAEAGTILLHSCNCMGVWGKGIAEQFRKRYPQAYRAYKAYCNANPSDRLVGQSMLIPPLPDDSISSSTNRSKSHYVACVFARETYGKFKNPGSEKILEATVTSMKHLLDGIKQMRENGEMEDFTELRMPKINSGLFSVPWEETEKALRNLDVPVGEKSISTVIVYTSPK